MKQSEMYEKYLNRLRRKREDNKFYTQSRRQLRALSQPFSEAKETYEDRLRREDLPESVAQEYALEHAQKWSGVVGKTYSEAESREEQRRERYNERIEELQFKKDMAEEQEEEMERKREESKLKSALGIGGSIVGGIAGSVIPGVGTAAGAKIGGGLGSVAGGVSGEDADMDMIGAGIGELAGGIASTVIDSRQKALASTISESSEELSQLNPEELDSLKMGLDALTRSGQYEKAKQYLQSILGGNRVY